MSTPSIISAGMGNVQQIWRLRHFILSLVQIDLRTRYRHSVLGIGWSFVRPLAMSAVLCVVFSKLFHMPLKDFAPYLLVGITFWQFFTESMVMGCSSFASGSLYIRQRDLPLSIFPLRTILGVGFHGIMALAMALFLTWIFRGFNPFPLLGLIPSLVLLFLLGWSLSLVCGICQCYFPDTQHLLEIGLQMLFYLSPILYSPDMLASRGRILLVLQFNPITYLLELVRVPVLHNEFPSLQAYAVSMGVILVVTLIALICLKKLGRKIVFWL